MALALRHSPEKFGLQLEKNGWCDLNNFIRSLEISIDDVHNVIKNCDKQRYRLNNEMDKIRANQGHSVSVEIHYNKVTNIPKKLYHGTKKEFLTSIMEKGLIPGNRTHVHISGDIETAKKVANRRKGESIILEIDPDNFETVDLFVSDNNVFLTKKVFPEYIKVLNPFKD